MKSVLKSPILIASASIATVVACVLMPILAPGNQKHAPMLFIVSAIVAACAGWLFVAFKLRFIGLVHAILMLLVGGYLLFVGLPYFIAASGTANNPASGTIALANLVLVAAGTVTTGAGIAVMSLVLSLRKKEGDSDRR